MGVVQRLELAVTSMWLSKTTLVFKTSISNNSTGYKIAIELNLCSLPKIVEFEKILVPGVDINFLRHLPRPVGKCHETFTCPASLGVRLQLDTQEDCQA